MLSAWEIVETARHRKRPNPDYYIRELVEKYSEFHGDRSFGDDGSVTTGIGLFEGQPVSVIGLGKGQGTVENIKKNFGMANPEGYKKAIKAIKQAEKFSLPVIIFVDTPGAYPGMEAENRGQGYWIAKSLMEMSKVKTPLITFITGEGGSGGALALAVSDRVFMLENSIYSILSPEGFSSILWKDSSRKVEAAEKMKITSKDLLNLSVIDGIIEENGSCDKDPVFTLDQIREKIRKELSVLKSMDINELVSVRYDKFRKMGAY